MRAHYATLAYPGHASLITEQWDPHSDPIASLQGSAWLVNRDTHNMPALLWE